MSARETVSAVNRFSLGARPGERDRIAGEPRAWLENQLRGDAEIGQFRDLPGSVAYLRRENESLLAQRQARRQPEADASGRTDYRRWARQTQRRELARRYRISIASEHGFVERLVRFWSNHFAISIDKRPAALYAAPMEREAIRPHVLGRFGDLLVAVTQHPGMLRYLDNVRSVGEASTFARRARQRAVRNGEPARRAPGLNENLARELLELHTLGVDAGYSQADVAELARAITGWGVPLPRDFAADVPTEAFSFREAAHEAGPRNVLGKRYAAHGLEQGERILADLAVHPATARHVCAKLARHLVSDAPSPALIEAMACAWERSGADLPAVYRALIRHPDAWRADACKFKTPDDFAVSALRASGARLDEALHLHDLLARMGQPPFTPRSPAGFADDADAWNGADALWKRVQAAQQLAEAAPAVRLDPMRIAGDAFGDALDAETSAAIHRAESPRSGLALLYASPAFQWRS